MQKELNIVIIRPKKNIFDLNLRKKLKKKKNQMLNYILSPLMLLKK